MAVPEETYPPLLQRLQKDLKNDLIAGLLVVIPLATTIWLTITVARWVITFLTRIPKQVNPFNDLNPLLGNVLNLLVGLAVPLLSILIIGLMARNIAGRWLLDFGERTLKAIPLAGSVYTTLKQLLETVLDSGNKFRRVVLVEYPRPGIWSIGFITGNVAMDLENALAGATAASERLVATAPVAASVAASIAAASTPAVTGPWLSVFIPTTPNPTTGWYAIFPEREVISTDMPVEDAFKVLISGGIVSPGSALALKAATGAAVNAEFVAEGATQETANLPPDQNPATATHGIVTYSQP